MNFALQLQTIFINQTPFQLFVPDALAIQEAYAKGTISFPYWSQVWPSSIALSEFIASNPRLVQNKKLLELGAGLGLPSIVASKFAVSVFCSDKEEEAVEIISKSAKHHQLENLQAAIIDWDAMPVEVNADILLLSDINYDPDAFHKLRELVSMFLKKGTTILLATPQRLMAKKFIEPLLPFRVQEEERMVDHKNEMVIITIMVLKNSTAGSFPKDFPKY